MVAEQWELCKSIFEQALDYEGSQQTAFLERTCRDKPNLRETVEALLVGHRSNTGFLEPPELSELQPLQEVLREEAAADPERVGQYRVLERISSGGMSRVFRAVRSDRGIHEIVAVKLIRRSMSTKAGVRRFRQERQMLANLDHPYIPRLIDGGTTESGLPFLAMEYVHGLPIDRYCDERGLCITQRLRVFVKVCSAVQYVHENSVIHHDLKPANILVTDAGVPKLLDFGISKRQSDEGAPSSAAAVRSPQCMTLRYASPEQVRGQTTTTASDVYSLGVILYELLTGRSPCNGDRLSRRELEQGVCDDMPENPNAAITSTMGPMRARHPDKLRYRFQENLDNILLTTLQKNPASRYSSVQQLSDEIGHIWRE
ncbi:MAG: serine/threonine protein kinase [Phycisphaerales bacterium]|nr:serine/threonine protein kinase [Phycisphaerales bacterium]